MSTWEAIQHFAEFIKTVFQISSKRSVDTPFKEMVHSKITFLSFFFTDPPFVNKHKKEMPW